MTGVLDTVGGEELLLTYLRHYWLSVHGLAREKDLYINMKNRITNAQGAINFADNLCQSSRAYAALISSDLEAFGAYGPEDNENLETLALMGMVQIRPLLLAILDVFEPEEVKRSLRLMVSWAVRLVVVGRLGGGTLERHYSERALDVRAHRITKAAELSRAMQGVIPADPEFKTAFEAISVPKSAVARYYLAALERWHSGSRPTADVKAVNLEHILPQSPSAAWNTIDLDTGRAYYNRLGNLALMRTKPNQAIGNTGFAEKAKMYALEPFKLTADLAKHPDWGVKEIEARQRHLARLAVTAWPI
jgi:hypothetical protein